MGTKRLPAQVIADDSNNDWRFEINQDLRMLLMNVPWVIFHENLSVVRPTTSGTCEMDFYTGGDTGSQFEFGLKCSGNPSILDLIAYNGGSYTSVLSVTNAGVVTIAGAKILTGSTTWDPANITAGNNATTTLTVTGAQTTNSIVHAGIPNGFIQDGLSLQAYVSSTNTVTLRLYNFSGAGINPASVTYRVVVFQY